MKTLGIIGGLGPESTVDYYQRIIALYRERTGDGSYPEFIINSLNLRKGLDFMDANDLPGMTDYLLHGIGKLARAGADFGLISANTPHIVFEDVAGRFVWNALHDASQLLSESFLARGNRASHA